MEAIQATLLVLGVCLASMIVPPGLAQAAPQADKKASVTNAEHEIVTLSKDKWRWMAERNVKALDTLFAPEAVFVHMGGTMSKSQELEVIKAEPFSTRTHRSSRRPPCRHWRPPVSSSAAASTGGD